MSEQQIYHLGRHASEDLAGVEGVTSANLPIKRFQFVDIIPFTLGWLYDACQLRISTRLRVDWRALPRSPWVNLDACHFRKQNPYRSSSLSLLSFVWICDTTSNASRTSSFDLISVMALNDEADDVSCRSRNEFAKHSTYDITVLLHLTEPRKSCSYFAQ